jgi:hypothetical protein
MSPHFVLSWGGSRRLRPASEAGRGSPGGNAPTSAPTGAVAWTGAAKRSVAVADLSWDGLQRERQPVSGVMWWPRTGLPPTEVEAGRPGCRSPRTNDAHRAAFGLHRQCRGARRQPQCSLRARTEPWRKRAGGSPATSSSAVVLHGPSSLPSAVRPSGAPWSGSVAARRLRSSPAGSPTPGRLGDQARAGGLRPDRSSRHRSSISAAEVRLRPASLQKGALLTES